MSLPEADLTVTRRRPSRALLALGVIALLASAAAGCGSGGFHPLYGKTESGESMAAKLAAVDITKIPGRVGQRIRNELIFNTTGGDHPETAEFVLHVGIAESVAGVLVQSDGNTTTEVYQIEASFKLTRLKDKKILVEGKSFARAPYQRYQPIYANVRARHDAEDRAAVVIATDIRNRIAAIIGSKS